ncbi:hypothetical protein [Bradyrhizobium prioriisuperbiae]|uniref:hypothetical protein n=1 Tax=Bradyrhizobium prioriisuperbiae TaxID=2854389 RepID=UPI0028E9DCD8|nr:hypothetical protein [Bradyrhizobium prioritasuperba]
MAIDPRDAAATLVEIDDISRRVRQSLFYQRASLILVLWGVLIFVGYVLNQLRPVSPMYVWNTINVLGIGGSFVIAVMQRGKPHVRKFEARLFLAFLLFFAFGVLWSSGLAHFSGRQLGAFWATYVMLAYTLVGLWVGLAFVAIGISITVLTLIGYFFAGPWFDLWMALVNGGGLILGGLWMRRD